MNANEEDEHELKDATGADTSPSQFSCSSAICFLPAAYNLFVTHPFVEPLWGQDHVGGPNNTPLKVVHWTGAPKPFELRPEDRGPFEALWWSYHGKACGGGDEDKERSTGAMLTEMNSLCFIQCPDSD